MGMTEVFDAENCIGSCRAFNVREDLLLQFQVLGCRLNHPIRVPNAGLERVDNLDPLERHSVSVGLFETCLNAREDLSACFGARIGDADQTSRAGEDLRDAAAHEAGAKDRDALSRHYYPAV